MIPTLPTRAPSMVTGLGSNWQFSGGGGMDPFTISMLVGTGANFLGNLFGGNQQKKLTERQLAEQKRQFDLSRQDQKSRDAAAAIGQARAEELQRQQDQAKTGLQATQLDPLAQQRARQRAAVMAALVGGARNYDVKPPSDIASSMPELSGGIRLPEGGFGPDVMSFFSPSARAGAEADFASARARVAPTSGGVDLSQVGYGAAGAAGTANAQAVGSQQEALMKDLENKRLNDILMALGLGTDGRPLTFEATAGGVARRI